MLVGNTVCDSPVRISENHNIRSNSSPQRTPGRKAGKNTGPLFVPRAAGFPHPLQERITMRAYKVGQASCLSNDASHLGMGRGGAGRARQNPPIPP